MSLRTKSSFRCTECGADHAKWQGRCDGCGEWNTLVEETIARPTRGASSAPPPGRAARPMRIADVDGAETARIPSGSRELDFVLGGGVVPGSMILVGGEPGIGKSTLLLQVAGSLAAGGTVLYVSG